MTPFFILQIFGVPSTARKAKPFIDHVLTFSILDSRVWFRNYQVRRVVCLLFFRCFFHGSFVWQIVENEATGKGPSDISLVEIGPRFVLTPIRIFEGAFGGATVYSNPGMFGDHVAMRSLRLLTFFILKNLFLRLLFGLRSITRRAVDTERGKKRRLNR
jgi:ribosome biogenesis protein BRX1